MDTQTQIDRLIELAIVQRSDLKKLVSELPQLRDHLNAEIERMFEDAEPQIRAELEDWTTKQAKDETAKLGSQLEAKLISLSKSLEATTQARYNAIMAERAQNIDLAKKAEDKLAEVAQAIPVQVKQIVTDELARFPRAGEIDQLRKEFAEPRGLNPRGRWQAGETYNKLDLVSYNGDSYVSNTDGNREKPSRSSEAWTLSAARGNGGAGGVISSLTDLVAVPSNGQLLIGNGSAFVNNTITAGTGVTVTNGPGTITIDASVAQEILTATVTNAESFAITRGQVVYLFGATGNRASVKLANNATDAESSKTFGIVSEASIAAGGNGLVTCVGTVDKLTLGSYTEGDVLYLGATPGSMTATKPYAPNHLVYVGIVERANNGNGELYVRIQNGFELDEIHDVQITTPPLAGALLMRDATNSLWKANRLTGTANQVTVTNADTAVTLSLPTAVANVNSVTAATTQNLTLTGGTSGASLVLGATTSGAAVLSVANATTDQNAAIVGLQLKNTNATTNNFAGVSNRDSANGYNGFSGFVNLVHSATNQQADYIISLANSFGTGLAEKVRIKNTGNLLIGTTTDMTGSGGLKIAGTTAATTTTSGALIVAGGVGVSGAGWFGGGWQVPFTAAASSLAYSNLNSSANASTTLLNGGLVVYAGGSAPYGLDLGYNATSSRFRARLFSNTGGDVALSYTPNAPTAQSSFTDGLIVRGDTGNVQIPSTTPSTGSTSGALQVAGGIYAGAASVFGSTLASGITTGGGGLTVTSTAENRVVLRSFQDAPVGILFQSNTQATGHYNWLVGSQQLTNQAFEIVPSTAINGTTFTTAAMRIDGATSAATFAGAVTTTSLTANSNIGTSTASTAILDYSAGARVIARGTGVANYGVVKIAGTDSAGSAAITGGIVATFDSSNGSSTFAGAVTMSDSSLLSKNQNATTSFGIRNPNGGTASVSALYVGNDTSNTRGSFFAFGTGYTTSNQYVAGSVLLESTDAAGLGISGTNSGPVKIWNNAGVTATFTATGTTFASIIKPQQATTAGAPAYVKGAIYFDTTLNKLRVGGATAWETITSV